MQRTLAPAGECSLAVASEMHAAGMVMVGRGDPHKVCVDWETHDDVRPSPAERRRPPGPGPGGGRQQQAGRARGTGRPSRTTCNRSPPAPAAPHQVRGAGLRIVIRVDGGSHSASIRSAFGRSGLASRRPALVRWQGPAPDSPSLPSEIQYWNSVFPHRSNTPYLDE